MELLVLSREVSREGERNAKVTLASSLEINILERFEQEVVSYLRTTLKNTKLLLENEVKEQETSKKLYTSKDKFEYMASKNPALKDMKERLGLDFEY